MFPSGKWTGHYDQYGEREVMQDLDIRFSGDVITGAGHDRVGPFTLSGQVLPGHCVEIVKAYDGQHRVVYRGEHDGEGAIVGVWSLTMDHGTFAMRPESGFLNDRQEIPEWQF